jgi:uncharacterized protein YjbI with pentapeptide repeats
MMHWLRERFRGITQIENFDYESSVFVDCVFEDVVSEGAKIDSHFFRCTFDNVDWYWCTGFCPVFVECTFSNCDLRGSFYSASFVSCKFTNCNTGNNNLGGTTEWENCMATECTLVQTVLPIVSTK